MPQIPTARAGEAQDVVVALESGVAVGEPGPLARIDTPMSHVFLGRTHAYKLKRAVRLPFADMSDLEARRRGCEAELAVNRALAPRLYEAVLPLTCDADGVIRLDGDGPALDWVVVMRRFPKGALLDEMAADGRLTPGLVREAATAIAAFHHGLEPRRDTGHAADYRKVVDGLRRTESEAAAVLGVRPASQDLFDALDHEILRQGPVIEARRRAGWVRRGHGDLHLRNICVFEGRVTPFDALEFDPALATTDVIDDLAFLLTDLRARGLPDLANLALNVWWDALDQAESGLALLPLFMALRSAVRMAVALGGGDLKQAQSYRQLGLDLLAPRRPRLLAIGGLSGSGKSVVAGATAPHLPGPCGGRILRTDLIRKIQAGAAPTDRLPSAAYGDEARARVYQALVERARQALAAESSVVADATFQEAEARAQIAHVGGAAFRGVWLRADPSIRAERVAARQGDASDATVSVALAQAEPEDLGPAWKVVDAARPADAVTRDVLEALTAAPHA
jgi:aminoglycoside phosphotransferase family enzyme/predicted kinase